MKKYSPNCGVSVRIQSVFIFIASLSQREKKDNNIISLIHWEQYRFNANV